MKIKLSEKDKEIEKAIIMLVDCVKENCRNPKPLILHSIKVGMELLNLNQPREVVIAGILHDLVEDTNCKISEIRKEFGRKIADLVSTLTQEKIENYKERWHVLLSKIKKAGKEAMIIKIVDNNDNLTCYIPLIKDKEILKETLWKQRFTIKSLRPHLANLKVFKEYCKNYKVMVTKLKNSNYTSLVEKNRGEEVEVKVKIKEAQIKKIKRKLFDLGAVFGEKKRESDIYFTAPHRNFIETKECLRIREKDGYLELTYKGPTTKSMRKRKQFWKSEINIPLNCSKKDIKVLLETLDFKKVVDVIKEREKFMLGGQIITLDKIENLGWFLEIEKIVEGKKERQKALKENINILRRIGLDEKDIITEPYRDLVLSKMKK